MKSKSILIFTVSLIATIAAQARTVEVRMSRCAKPLLESLRQVAKPLGYNDKLVLNFDKAGKYEIDGTLRIGCNVEIKGLGPKSTRVIVKDGNKFTDDCFFRVMSGDSHTVSASIHDIAFELASHKGVLWEKAPKHLVKIWNGDGISVDNTEFKCRDAMITCLDLRECSNVSVTNSTFENYNNCEGGGCLWTRDNQRNVTIRNNVFRKYGEDEPIAVWGTKKTGNYVMENIAIEDNKLYYGDNTKCGRDYVCGMLISLYHCRDEWVQNSTFNISNVTIANNEITLNWPVKFVMMVKFDDLATQSGITISGNTITKSKTCGRNMSDAVTDFHIDDCSANQSTITLSGNSSTNEEVNLNKYATNYYSFVTLAGGNLHLLNNSVSCSNGLRLLVVNRNGGNVTMNGNKADGLYNLASIASNSSEIKPFTLVADCNVFAGDTRIYMKNLKEGNFTFTDNTFHSTDYHLLLQEAPLEKLNVTFENNTIYSAVGKGTLSANYSGVSCRSQNIVVRNNVFHGIGNASAVMGEFSKSSRKSISGNSFFAK